MSFSGKTLVERKIYCNFGLEYGNIVRRAHTRGQYGGYHGTGLARAARSRPGAAARQLVNHRHIVVDGKVVGIASYSVQPGQIVGVRERSKSFEVIEASLAGFNHAKYPWLEWDANSMSGKYLHKPERADIPENIKEQLIVELYSK